MAVGGGGHRDGGSGWVRGGWEGGGGRCERGRV